MTKCRATQVGQVPPKVSQAQASLHPGTLDVMVLWGLTTLTSYEWTRKERLFAIGVSGCSMWRWRCETAGGLGMLTLPARGFNLNFLVARVMSLTEWPPVACLFFFGCGCCCRPSSSSSSLLLLLCCCCCFCTIYLLYQCFIINFVLLPSLLYYSLTQG